MYIIINSIYFFFIEYGRERYRFVISTLSRARFISKQCRSSLFAEFLLFFFSLSRYVLFSINLRDTCRWLFVIQRRSKYESRSCVSQIHQRKTFQLIYRSALIANKNNLKIPVNMFTLRCVYIYIYVELCI